MTSVARKAPTLALEHPADVALIKAHLAGSLGVEKADAVVTETLRALGLPLQGELPAEHAEQLMVTLAAEPGLVGLAARVAKQMLRSQLAPLKPR